MLIVGKFIKKNDKKYVQESMGYLGLVGSTKQKINLKNWHAMHMANKYIGPVGCKAKNLKNKK